MNQATRQSDYVKRGRNQIGGWFSRVDAEIFNAITQSQNQNGLTGSVVEIGLHHGKSFLALCLALKDTEKAYGIDLFENQALNQDRSGKGVRTVVEANLTKHGVDLSRVVLDGRSSQAVRAADIKDAVGEPRFFSVDGGHWLDVVENDLLLAEAITSKYGVIALDDFHRPEWPDVSAGYFSWWAKRSKPIVPLAIGFNKLYLCFEESWNLYVRVLEENPFLKKFLSKRYEFQGQNIPVYQSYILPEWSFKQRVIAYLKMYQPDLYVAATGIKNKMRRSK